MKSRNIRILLILAVLVCAGIIATQVYWVRSAYVLNEERFQLNVSIALRNAAESLMHAQGIQSNEPTRVEQLSTSCFAVHVNAPVPKGLLEAQLSSALAAQHVAADFQYELSANTATSPISYAGYIQMNGNSRAPEKLHDLPVQPSGHQYIGICFPQRASFLRSRMLPWAGSSLLLLIAIGFLGYLLFLNFQERSLVEVQKDFVANMTHEFKTPLASIRLGADVLKNPEITGQPQRLLSYATIISNSAMHLTSQVDRILQMSKAESEGLQLNRTDFVWQDLLRAELPAYAQLAAAGEGSVSLQLATVPIHFKGDKEHLKSAIFNLVDNGLKYSLAPPRVHISLQQEGKQIILKVRDEGIGIDKASQRHLFERFFRVHTGNVHDVKGFGIGLNYVRIIVRAHGGDVKCDSQLGKGSTFTVILPLS